MIFFSPQIKTNENDVSLSVAIKTPMDLVILAAFSESMGSFVIVIRMVVWLGVHTQQDVQGGEK